MNCFLTLPVFRLILFSGLVALLSSCAPTPGMAPSGALKQQLSEIRQQQQLQATQLQQLQQQLSQLQKQLPGGDTVQENAGTRQEVTIPTTPLVIPQPSDQFSGNQDVANVAASASSYLAAFSNLAAGNTAAAEAGFENFLREFPNHQYAPNARYWLASAQLAQGKTNPAISNLNQIITNPKAQTKAPAALLQLAQIYRQAGLTIQADNVLEQLRDRYPDSPEAQQFNRSNEPTE